MVEPKRETTARHPIGVASIRTGIAEDVLRAWERRYRAVVPHRTPTGRRLYTDEELVRLSLLRRLVEGGRRISDIANATTEDLKALGEEDRGAFGERTADGSLGSEIRPATYLEAALEAVSALSQDKLARVLGDAALSMSPPEVRTELIAPLLDEIGRRWRSGRVRIVHEHTASTIVRKFLEGMRDRAGKDARPRLVVTTPAGQRHEFGAIMAALAAEEMGWEAVYLGADLPTEEIGVAARQLGARVVALSIVYKGDERRLLEEIADIKQLLDPAVPLVIGGQAAGKLRSLAEETGAVFIDDLGEFQRYLESLFGGGGER